MSKKYPTVFDITKQRLILSSKQIQEEYSNPNKINLSFKIFETIPLWDDYHLESDKLSSQTKLFDESKLNDKDLKTLLITWKTADGVPLTDDFEEYSIDDYKGTM